MCGKDRSFYGKTQIWNLTSQGRLIGKEQAPPSLSPPAHQVLPPNPPHKGKSNSNPPGFSTHSYNFYFINHTESFQLVWFLFLSKNYWWNVTNIGLLPTWYHTGTQNYEDRLTHSAFFLMYSKGSIRVDIRRVYILLTLSQRLQHLQLPMEVSDTQ